MTYRISVPFTDEEAELLRQRAAQNNRSIAKEINSLVSKGLKEDSRGAAVLTHLDNTIDNLVKGLTH